MKTILVPFQTAAGDGLALENAFRIARLFNAHVEALHVQPSAAKLALAAMPPEGSPWTSGAALSERWAALAQAAEAQSNAARKEFKGICAKAGIAISATPDLKLASANWTEARGDDIQELVAPARLSDLVVTGRAPASGHLGAGALGELLLQSSCPVLVAGTKLNEKFPRAVVVGWKESREAARAVSGALDILREASDVTVLTVYEDRVDKNVAAHSTARCVERLSWRGVAKATGSTIACHDGIAETLVKESVSRGADLLVMGAYGHSRAAEFVFGGVTRYMLNDAPIPILLAH